MVTEDDIEHAIEHSYGPEESAFAQARMNIATDVSIFSEEANLQLGVVQKGIT